MRKTVCGGEGGEEGVCGEGGGGGGGGGADSRIANKLSAYLLAFSGFSLFSTDDRTNT